MENKDISNPFYLPQAWPNWEPLHLGSVPWALVAVDFFVQTVRPQKVVEYSVRSEAPPPTSQTSAPAPATPTAADPRLQSMPFNRSGGGKTPDYAYLRREAVVRDTQEALMEGVIRMERELSPFRDLAPEIRTTYAPEWRPLTLPKAYIPESQKPEQKKGRPQHPNHSEGSSPITPFTFLIFLQTHQIPSFCSQSGSGLVCLRACTIQSQSAKPWLKPLDAGILTLVQPIIHIQGLLPLSGPPIFPLQDPGPVSKRMNEVFEISRQRDRNGVLWSLVDWEFQHPVLSGL